MNEQEAIEKLFETAIERLDYKSSMPKIDVLTKLLYKQSKYDELEKAMDRTYYENRQLIHEVKALKKTILELKPQLKKRSKHQLIGIAKSHNVNINDDSVKIDPILSP